MSFLSIRVSEHHKRQDLLEEFLELVRNHREVCEEIWFSSDYGFPGMETHRMSAEKMTSAAELIRKEGICASLQISNTLGHGDYNRNLDYSGITWQRMTGHDGIIAGYCNCPRDPSFLQYIYDSTALYAAWKPDVVWVDDDLRMNFHMPVEWGCFCDRCITEFSEQYGVEWAREELVAAINRPDDWTWRKKWTEFGNDSLCLVMEVIAKAVLKVSPGSTIGLQHAGSDWAIYSGQDYLRKIAEVVMRVTGKKMLSRPGGGYYSDRSPFGMLDKAFALDLSISCISDIVEDFRPEIETFPHTAMHKTPHGLAVESMLDLAYGCNALSFAVMMVENERPGYFDPMFKRFREWLPFWKYYVQMNKDTLPGGLRVYYNGRQFERRLGKGEKAFEWANPLPSAISHLTALGLPITFRSESTSAVILTAEVVDGISEKELREIFSGGVITDGEVITKLQQRGLIHLTGVTAEKIESINSVEKLTGHEINGPYAERLWIQYLPIGVKGVHKVTSTNPDAGILGKYVYADGSVCGTASIAVETPLGGRLAVFGYNLWESVVNTARRYQLVSAADWVSRGKLPVFVESEASVILVPRIDTAGRLRSVFVLNPSIDYSPQVKVHLRNIFGEKIMWKEPFKDDIPLNLQIGNGSIKTDIPPIAPWSIGVMEIV